MRKNFRIAVLLCMVSAGMCLGQTAPQEPEAASLCSLQQKIGAGDHESVRVSGIYGPGLDHTVLEEPSCPNEGTWVELELQSNQNKEKLRKMLDNSRRAYVVVEGEFYGPPLPDPKLPEAIRKAYHPGWGHLSAFNTKLVVHVIRDVEAAPPDHPASADLNYSVPILQEATQPRYPPIAKAAHVTGKVSVRVTVKDGQVMKTDVVSKLNPAGQRFLETPTVENLKTWRFAADVNGEFTVTYTYAIAGGETEAPTNPTVEMLPSLDVNITARPDSSCCTTP